jgi:hypothetical protein
MNTETTSRSVICPKCGEIVFVHGSPTDELAVRLAVFNCPGCKRRRKAKPEPREIRQPYNDN